MVGCMPDPGGGLEFTGQPLITAPAYRARRLAFVLVDIGGGVNLTEREALKRLTGTAAGDESLRQYYVEASFGRQDLDAKVFGPFSFPMSGCNIRDLAMALRPMVPDGFDHYLWYMGSRNRNCDWFGFSTSGTPAQPTRDTWYNARLDCFVLVQEPGHNFGMDHSSSLRCPGAAFVDDPEGSCQHDEYGDLYDPMGSPPGGACRHMNAYQKAYQGWFGGCNVVDATQAGTFTLLPIELPCNGVQVLQIPMPRTRPYTLKGGGTVNLTHYYVEMRSPVGFDRPLRPQVQIRVSTDIRLRTQGGRHTWLLDMEPATAGADSFEGLGSGESFRDPTDGVKITVQSLDATKATVRVELANQGAPSACLDGAPLPLPGPGPESCAAGPAVPGAAPAPPPDGGTPRVPDGSAVMADMRAADTRSADVVARDGGAAGAGADGGDADSEETTAARAGGCGCRTGGRPGGGWGALTLLVALAWVRACRRRHQYR